MPDQRILLVEDEAGWVELVFFWLKKAGYSRMDSAGTGVEALEKAIAVPPDCLLLDLVLPDQSGMEVCKKFRAQATLSRIPVVLFTGHKREKVMGLQSGADYFVGKSDNPNELLATLEAVFRRQQMEAGMLSRGPLMLRSSDRTVYASGSPVAVLPPKMFLLFFVLVERSPQAVSRADLFRLVEGTGEPGLSRALDVMLNRLRHALPADLSRRIVSVKNFGYLFLDA
ncbi:MAG: response regulator transcription factor [Elusimicrobiota bacterium]